MKKIIVIFSAMFMVLFLAACGDDTTDQDSDDTIQDEVEDTIDDLTDDNEGTNDDKESTKEEDTTNKNETKDENQDVPEEAKDQDDMKKMMDALNFDEIELEVSYAKDKEYQFDIDIRDNGDIEADFEDELNGEDIEDDLKAFNKLYPKVKQLEIEQDTSKDDVIKQVLDIFELDDNYEEFEIEVKFDDGTKLSYEDKK